MTATWQERNEAVLVSLHPVLATRKRAFLIECSQMDIPVLLTEGLRPWERQTHLYAMGRTIASTACCKHAGIEIPVGLCKVHPLGATVTNAEAGYSWHQFAGATDDVPDDLQKAGMQLDWNPSHAAWQQMLRIGRRHKLAEGAAWRTYPDNPHFYPEELPPTPPRQVRELYTAGGMVAAWEWMSREIKA